MGWGSQKDMVSLGSRMQEQQPIWDAQQCRVTLTLAAGAVQRRRKDAGPGIISLGIWSGLLCGLKVSHLPCDSPLL